MDLKEFVAESLTQIIAGVVDAQSRAREHGAFVNPQDNRLPRDKGHAPKIIVPGRPPHIVFVQNVEFDVAVVVSDDLRTKVGAGVLTVVSAGGNRERSTGNETTTRIRFQVPLALPVHKSTTPGQALPTQPKRRPLPGPSASAAPAQPEAGTPPQP